MTDPKLDQLYDALIQAEANEQSAHFVTKMSDAVQARAMYEIASEELTAARAAYDAALNGAVTAAVGASA